MFKVNDEGLNKVENIIVFLKLRYRLRYKNTLHLL